MSDNDNNKLPKFFTISVAVIIALFLIFLQESNRDKAVSFLNTLNRGEKDIELVNSINTGRALDLKVYGDNMFLWRDGKLSLYDIKGELKIEKQFDLQVPMIHFGDKYIYIADKSNLDFYKFDKNGEKMETMKFRKPLFNIVEENKHTIYHTKDSESESIYIYNKDDVLIGDHTFRDKNIINSKVSNSGEYALALLDLSGSKIISVLEFYGKNKEKLHSMDIDNEIILYINFIGKKGTIALTDSSLYSIESGKKMWKKSFKLIKDIYIEDKIYLLYSNYLEIIDFDGRTVEKTSFTKDYNRIVPFKGDTLVYGNTGMCLISNGNEILKSDLDISVLDIGKNNIVILKKDKMDIYKLIKK